MEPVQPKPKRSGRGWLLILGIAAGLTLLFLLGWLPRLSNKKVIDAIAAEAPLPRVSVLVIKPNTKPIELILPSSAQAWHITPIWARVNGYLIRYLVDIGDPVRVGDLLAEIDTPETDEAVAQAQADLLNSIAVRDIAKITNDRWQRLWNKNREAVSKQEVDQYQANYQAAEATVVANEKNVSRLTYQQQFKYIYAPFDGVIIQRNVDIGSLVYGNINGTPQELFQLAQTHTIRFFVDVPQNYFRQIKEGIEAEITVSEFPGKTFKGIVTRYAKALDPTARTLLTEVDVDNPDGILYAGLFGRVKFFLKPDTINFIIPTTAIIIRAGFPNMAVVDENNIVHLRQVQIGRDYGKQMEITSGLQENDRIITIPSDRIFDGVKVEIISENHAQTN
ncbi:efflux RND transporter periplasmic adaptor subunit [Candidatus Protochlamydia phocaeensis]|uniref:efflux RND transporter periplasmic adaptor subunit n=1 Tax=Candidatus Protochlamydia phocaeensis TaxID=1414722 RepID=UPI000838B715|nr:efflux RND transporter periplasmic adaptor subunit [Candidatus Protochlamydia phocaeensis]